MHIRTSSQAHVAILPLSAHNLHAAFSLTRVPTPYSASSSSTALVYSVRAFVTSLLHLFNFIRHDSGFLHFLSVSWGWPAYSNKSGRVDTLNPKHSLFIYHRDHWLLPAVCGAR